MPTSRKTPKSHDPQPPATLSAPARKLWNQIAFDYAITDSASLSLLSMAMAAWDRAEAAARIIAKEGLMVPTARGPRAHAAAAVERDARTQYLRCLKSLNLDIAPPHDGPGRPPNDFGGY